MKAVTMYTVWEKDIPYLTCTGLDTEVAEPLGFDVYEPKDEEAPSQWFIEKPSKKRLPALLDALKDRGVAARIVKYIPDKSESLGWDIWAGYYFGYKPNNEMKRIAEKIISSDRDHSHLIGARILYVFRPGKPPKGDDGRYVVAYAQLAPKISRRMGKYDFFIVAYESIWDELKLVHKKRVIDHELMHCGFKGSPYLIDHDIEEFRRMYRKYKVNVGDDVYSGVDDLIDTYLEEEKELQQKGKVTRKKKEEEPEEDRSNVIELRNKKKKKRKAAVKGK